MDLAGLRTGYAPFRERERVRLLAPIKKKIADLYAASPEGIAAAAKADEDKVKTLFFSLIFFTVRFKK